MRGRGPIYRVRREVRPRKATASFAGSGRGMERAQRELEQKEQKRLGTRYGMRKHKVIVVGGGPAGSLTALSLLRLRPELAGDVMILEARRFPRTKICGGGVSGRVTARMEELGIDLEDLPRRFVSGFTVCYGSERYYPSFGNERCFITRRSLLDDMLLREAGERGAEVRTAAPVRGAYRERKGVAVVLRDGGLCRGEVLVGADGVNGLSRTWFGLPPRGHKYLLLQVDVF